VEHLEPGRTELQDLDRPFTPSGATFSFERDARLFARDRALLHELGRESRTITLAADELLHPPVPVDGAVRRGKLRVSEFLADGREVTRAVLQAGAVFRTRPKDSPGVDLGAVVLMALGEAELWFLPAGSLARIAPPVTRA
jgi:hypothetical protein